MELGKKVRFQEQEFYVYEADSVFVGDELIHTYTLRRKGGFHVAKSHNAKLTGVSLSGVVIDAKNDTVKVQLDVDEKQDGEAARWFAYYCLTPKSEYTFGHMDLKYIEIDKDKVGDKAVFKLKGVEKSYIIARLDMVESLLRRGGKGIMVREINVSEGSSKEDTGSILDEKEKWQKQRTIQRSIW